MDLTWLDPAQLDRRDVDGAVAVFEAARLVDCPHELAPTVASYTADLQHGWDGDAPRAAVARDSHGRVVGVLHVDLPTWDNRHLGYLEVTVDPLVRRQGLGRRLFEAGVDLVRAEGRTVVLTGGFDSEATTQFAAALGMEPAMNDAKRQQDLRQLDWSALDVHWAEAVAASADYELVRMPVSPPDDLMPAVLTMLAAINDAPTDDLDIEDEVFSVERHQAFLASRKAHHQRYYQLAARHRGTGVLAGHTVVAVESDRPSYGHQFDTSVLAEHRGHRLGLLLKIGMLHWLAEAEPGLRTVQTWNAVSNDHMIAVNEALGYHVVATGTEYQRHLTDDRDAAQPLVSAASSAVSRSGEISQPSG